MPTNTPNELYVQPLKGQETVEVELCSDEEVEVKPTKESTTSHDEE